MHGDAQYADVLERVIYNGILSGIGMDGEHFFYVNPLAADGNHHRQPFFPCACCPTNVVRFLPSLPGYVYATSSDGIYVNLYVAGDGQIAFRDTPVSIRQETEYPWDGQIKLTVSPKTPCTFDLHLRIPGWCAKAQLTVNGAPAESQPNEKGYAVLHREWKPGDTVDLQLPMEVQRIEAHPLVTADAGRVAIQRGPIVYCFEAVDNGGQVRNIVLERDPKFEIERRADLLGGVTAHSRPGARRPAGHRDPVLRVGPSRARRHDRVGAPGRQVARATAPTIPAGRSIVPRARPRHVGSVPAVGVERPAHAVRVALLEQ